MFSFAAIISVRFKINLHTFSDIKAADNMMYVPYYTKQRSSGFIDLPADTPDSNGGHKHEDAYQTDSIRVKWSHKYTQQNKHRNNIRSY